MGASFHKNDESCGDQDNLYSKYGMAKYVTMWMALSDATPENSCLYVIPAADDPGYYDGDNVDESKPDPLQTALTSKVDYQNIRALPRKAGESVVFTHRILHWGSKGNKRCKLPRIALSFVVSAEDFEKPYIDPTFLTESSMPQFQIRLLLVCAQLIIYYQRFDLSVNIIRACYDFCQEYKEILDDTYFQKVRLE